MIILIYQRGDQYIEVDGESRAAATNAARDQAEDMRHDFGSYRCIAEYPAPKKVNKNTLLRHTVDKNDAIMYNR